MSRLALWDRGGYYLRTKGQACVNCVVIIGVFA